jgi:hypothetical protein
MCAKKVIMENLEKLQSRQSGSLPSFRSQECPKYKTRMLNTWTAAFSKITKVYWK